MSIEKFYVNKFHIRIRTIIRAHEENKNMFDFFFTMFSNFVFEKNDKHNIVVSNSEHLVFAISNIYVYKYIDYMFKILHNIISCI